MSRPVRTAAALIAALTAGPLLSTTAGCGGARTAPKAPAHHDIGTLEEVGELYLATFRVNQAPPASADDLVRDEHLADGAKALAKGEILVRWGIAPFAGGDSPEVLAYRADVPTKGGYVLLTDMIARSMTPEEFRAAVEPPAPAAGPTSPAGGEAAPKPKRD